MRTKLKSFILTALLFGAIHTLNAQAMADTDSVPKSGKKMLMALNGKWFLQPVLPSDTTTGRLAEIVFDVASSHFTGNTGCNRMSGTVLISDTSLHFSDKIATTRMACTGYNEPAFLQNLLRIDGYKFEKNTLILTVNGVEVSRWTRQIEKPKKTGKA